MNDDLPIANLTQTFGPFRSEWSLHADHLAIETSGPFGRSYVPLELSRLDGFSYEDGPFPALAAAAAAALALACGVVLGALAGAVGLWAVFTSAALAAFLVTSCRLLRHERVVVHTLGARRFVIHAGLSSADVRDRFLQALERVRSSGALAPAGLGEEAGEDAGPDLDEPSEPEAAAGSRGPLDRRWIN